MDMNINLNIVATELCEAINNLAGAVMGMGSNTVATVEQPAHARKARTSKVADVVAPEPTETEPVADPAPVVAKEAAEVVQDKEVIPAVEAGPKFTLEQVRAKLTELSTANHKDEIKALFAKFGAKKLTEVPAENYAELMAAAEMIG